MPVVQVPTIVPRTFGEFLRAVRESEGLSYDELAQLLDLTQGAVRAWEEDAVAPVRENYEKLLQVLPALASGPRPASRDIPKPAGRGAESPAPAPEVPEQLVLVTPTPPAPTAPATPRHALVAFGVAVGRTAAALDAGQASRNLVVTLLRTGAAAGLSAADIADEIASAAEGSAAA